MLAMQEKTLQQQLRDAKWGPSRLASALGIRSQAVSQWTEVPARRVPEVERLTGIPAHKLCPSYFPKPEVAEGQAA